MKFSSIFFSLALATQVSSQTNISGVINIYTQITGINNNILTVLNSTGYAIHDKVLIYQVQGASIDITNSYNYGNLSGYNAAGHFELNYVKRITGNTIELCGKPSLTYDPNYPSLLIRIPVYDSVNVSGTLTAATWDGNTGGVLVFEADYINLSADIDVSGQGFRGGQGCWNNNGSCGSANTGYYYSIPSGKGGAKGEGIKVRNMGQEVGKGKISNGGGGGNKHNSGGAGGGNYTAGGHGGKSASFCGSDTIGGVGGVNLAYSISGNRIFLGGGGGAGDYNDAVGSDGGSGGGIVIIIGKKIKANYHSIKANGKDVPTIINNIGDGAGGGGAGGVIILMVDSIDTTSTLYVEVNGGKGGSQNTSYAACFGTGGGGGTGLTWVKNSQLLTKINLSSNPGTAGYDMYPSSSCYNNTYGAGNGVSGNGLLNGILIIEASQCFMSFAYSNTCDKGFFLTNTSDSLSYDNFVWYYKTLTNQVIDSSYGYHSNYQFASAGKYIVTLLARNSGTGLYETITKTVEQNAVSRAKFGVSSIKECEGAHIYFNDSSVINSYSIPITYHWVFGDGKDSIMTFNTPPSNLVVDHIFKTQGSYRPKLYLDNGYCKDTFIYLNDIVISKLVLGGFKLAKPSACNTPFSIRITDTLASNIKLKEYDLGTGTYISVRNDQVFDTSISFTTKGIIRIRQRVTNNSGCEVEMNDSCFYAGRLIAKYAPINTQACQYVKLSFTDSSIIDSFYAGKIDYHWYFGDGADSLISYNSIPLNPVMDHIYKNSGTYYTSLIIDNGSCIDTFKYPNVITIIRAPKPGFSILKNSGCAPATIRITDTLTSDIDTKEYDLGNGIFINVRNYQAFDTTITVNTGGNYNIRQKLVGVTGCIVNYEDSLKLLQGIDPAIIPTLFVATFTNDSMINIRWKPVADAESYNIYKNTKFLANTTNTFYDENIKLSNYIKSTTQYTITALDVCKRSTQLSNIGQPILLDAINNDSNIATIRWTPYEDWENGVDQYHLSYSIGNAIWIPIADLNNSLLAYLHNLSDSSLTQGNSDPLICYRILASELQGNGQLSQSNTACVRLKSTLFIPNVFSPNSDGLNEVFRPFGIGLKSYELEIYSRWGEMVYFGNESGMGWDGNLRSGAPALPGEYIFVLRAMGAVNDNEKTLKSYNVKGAVLLVR